MGVAASTSTPYPSSVPAPSSTGRSSRRRPGGRAGGTYSGAVTAVQQPPAAPGPLDHGGRRVVPSARRRLAPGCATTTAFTAWAATARASPCWPASCGCGSSPAERLPLRRDLLRQGRLVAVAPRLRHRLRRRRQPEDPRGHLDGLWTTRRAWSCTPRPASGSSAWARAVRDGPVRLADRLGGRRHADGRGDGPARPPDDRLDRCWAAWPDCCCASTACSSCCRGSRCSTSSWPSSCSARWPAWSPTATGAAPGWPGWCPTGSRCPATGGPSGPCCGGRGGSPPASASAWPARPSGTRSSRSPPSGSWSGCGTRAPAARSGCAGPAALARCRRAACVRLPRARRARRVRRELDRLAAARERVRTDPLRHAVRALLGHYLKHDAHGFLPELWQSLRSLWHYHHDVYAFHTQFLDDSKHVYQSKPQGWLILNRPVGVQADLGIKPGEQGCQASPGAPACARSCCSGRRPCGGAGPRTGLRGLRLGRQTGLAVRARGRRRALVWLPWIPNDDRPIFSYYAVAIIPFTILAITLCPRHDDRRERASYPRAGCGYVVSRARSWCW